MAEAYIKPAETKLLDFSLSESGDDLLVDLNLSECVKTGSPFINFGTAAPSNTTKGKIYIQIEG